MLVADCRLCRHCRNLAEGDCLLSRFHFTRCRYFLGHVACRNLPWQGLTKDLIDLQPTCAVMIWFSFIPAYTTKDPIDPLLTCVVIILLSFTTRTRSTSRRHAGLFTTFHITLCKLEWGARCLQKWHYKRIQSFLHRGEKWLQCYWKPPSRTAMAPNWWIKKIYFIQCHGVSLHNKRRRSCYK